MKTGVVWDRWCKLAFEYWTVTLWGQTVSNWNTKTELISQDLRFVGNFIIYFKHPSMAKRGKVACKSARFPFFIERNLDRMSKLAHLEWNKVLPWGIKSPLLSAALRTPSFSSILYPPWPSLHRGGNEITFVILNHPHAFPLNSNGWTCRPRGIYGKNEDQLHEMNSITPDGLQKLWSFFGYHKIRKILG